MKHLHLIREQGPIEIGFIPYPITPTADLDARLEGFPVNLLFASLVTPLPEGVDASELASICGRQPDKLVESSALAKHVRPAWYLPDPDSFVEDEEAKQMLYLPLLPAPYWARVVFRKQDSLWKILKYRDDELALDSQGIEYARTFFYATLHGTEPDEALEDWAERLREMARLSSGEKEDDPLGFLRVARVGVWKPGPITKLTMPKSVYRLEEVNLPRDLAESLAGRSVQVDILPEELACTRQVSVEDAGKVPIQIDPDGNCWNDYEPARILLADLDDRVWRLPRRWLPEYGTSTEPPIEAIRVFVREPVLTETLHLPTRWDLEEINIPLGVALEVAGKPAQITVKASPGRVPEVYWRDPTGATRRLPHDWRRRRIRLPDAHKLAAEQIPAEVAERYAHAEISVNYHPGSLCCMPEHYRFRDEQGNRWPVKISDCTILGYGDAPMHLAEAREKQPSARPRIGIPLRRPGRKTDKRA